MVAGGMLAAWGLQRRDSIGGSAAVGAAAAAAAAGTRRAGTLICGAAAGLGAGASCAEALAANSIASEAVRTGPQAPMARENLNFENTELVTKTLT